MEDEGAAPEDHRSGEEGEAAGKEQDMIVEAAGKEQDMSVEELLGFVPAAAKALAPASPEKNVPEQARGPGEAAASAEAVVEDQEEFDLPEPTTPVPPEVSVHFVSVSLNWSMQCALNLKSLAFGMRNAELGRRGKEVLLRFLKPRVTVNLAASGRTNVVNAKITEEEALLVAAKATRMVQKCGYPDAKCGGLRVRATEARAELRFPVRLEALAEKWRWHVLYEPEVTSRAFFFLKKPRCTVGVTSGGKVILQGFKLKADAQEAFRRTYPIFLEFSR